MKKMLCVAAFGLLAACGTPPVAPDAEGWHGVAIPGKRATVYAWTVKDGRRALAAHADQSASLWRRRVHVAPERLSNVRFSWWVDAPLAGADLSAAGLGDAPARVLFSFAGDENTLSPRNRLLFDLAETLNGERPPHATLMYVFGNDAVAPDQVLIHPRTDRVRKIVLDVGPGQSRRWREHRRDLAADFRRAFGEEPGALVSVAVMTDADNTQQQARAWYGPIVIEP
jgi:hypothetical protein